MDIMCKPRVWHRQRERRGLYGEQGVAVKHIISSRLVAYLEGLTLHGGRPRRGAPRGAALGAAVHSGRVSAGR